MQSILEGTKLTSQYLTGEFPFLCELRPRIIADLCVLKLLLSEQ